MQPAAPIRIVDPVRDLPDRSMGSAVRLAATEVELRLQGLVARGVWLPARHRLGEDQSVLTYGLRPDVQLTPHGLDPALWRRNQLFRRRRYEVADHLRSGARPGPA